MNIQDIPLICPNFNQLTYLRNLINWFSFYYPKNPVIVIDNNSDYEPLLEFYRTGSDAYEKDNYDCCLNPNFTAYLYHENNFIGNLKNHLDTNRHEYYILSDPDIMPHPTTPPNFLEIFKSILDSGFHHVGFDLITSDIPYWNKKAGWIQGDEALLHQKEQKFEYEDKIYEGYKAPIDTTFALYSQKNGGWSAPQSAESWSSSIRLFNAFHLAWYQDINMLNDEMKHYYATCKRFEPGMVSAGLNNHRPE